MAIYKGKPVLVGQPIEMVFEKISDMSGYQARLDSLPEEARAKLGDVKFTEDSIVINSGPVGEICFKIVEKSAPTLVKLSAVSSPVPFGIAIRLSAENEGATNVASELDVDIPAMLRPMVGGKLQEAADKFSELVTLLFV